ncbi:hypothetical protein BCV70DRAFT_138816, partial [Testicularia cyperi]
MTEEQPRQLMPTAESHQNLSSKLGAARPLPPRSRSKVTIAARRKDTAGSAAEDGSGSEAAHNSDVDINGLQSSNDTQTSRASADLEGRGTASPVPQAVQRSVSGISSRSQRSISDQHAMVEDIPKEEIERALEGLDRDDLVVALGRAKVQMDEIEARLEDQVLENETLHAAQSTLVEQLNLAEKEVQDLHIAVKQREDKIDEIMSDQDRMESEVFSTMQVIERLRKQLSETEKSRNDAEKRYVDQTATMDKERQYYADTESLLKSQKTHQASAYEKLLSSHHELLKEHERVTNKLAAINASNQISSDVTETGNHDADENGLGQDSSLGRGTSIDAADSTTDDIDDLTVEGLGPASQVASRAIKSKSFADERELVELREELATTQKSHASLSETMATLQTELRDVRAQNAALRDQNETFIDILQEKTFSGALLNESAMLRGLRATSGHREASKGLMDPYDSDEVESESTSVGDEGESERDFSTGTIPEENEDDVDDVPDTPKAPTTSIKKSRRRRKESSDYLHPPSDLASELEQLESTTESPENKARRERRLTERTGTVSENVDELQKEVRELREANQGLSLYINKILDRIIAKEGFEHILAIDGRGTVRGARRKASRATLGSAFQPPSDVSPGARHVSSASTVSAPGSTASGGGGFFSFGAASSAASAPGEASIASKPKSKRTSSIDWRNLPFLGGGSASAAENNANLRPLTLQSHNLLIPPRDGSARKLRTSEEMEDEHDVAERERIRQELLKRGIEPPQHQLVQSPVGLRRTRPQSMSANPSAGAGGFAAFFSRVVGSGPGGLLSPAKSDGQSQASLTPLRAADAGFGSVAASTPAHDVEKRREERTRALQLSEGDATGLTKLVGGQGIASKARQLRAERHQQTLEHAADTTSVRFPSSSASSHTASGFSSRAGSVAESSMMDNSVAGDESYCLPAPPSAAKENGYAVDNRTDSPLMGYGQPLPPLPTETTGDEDPNAFRSPTTSLQGSADQGWKRTFRRISLLSASSNSTNPD